MICDGLCVVKKPLEAHGSLLWMARLCWQQPTSEHMKIEGAKMNTLKIFIRSTRWKWECPPPEHRSCWFWVIHESFTNKKKLWTLITFAYEIQMRHILVRWNPLSNAKQILVQNLSCNKDIVCSHHLKWWFEPQSTYTKIVVSLQICHRWNGVDRWEQHTLCRWKLLCAAENPINMSP